MRAYFISERINFNREGTPLEKMGIGKHKIPSAKQLIGHKKWANKDDLERYQGYIDRAMAPEKSSGFRKYIQFVVENGHITASASSVFDSWVEQNINSLSLKEVRDALEDLWPGSDREAKTRCLHRAERLGITESQHFERTGTPLEKLNIGEAVRTNLVKEFLRNLFDSINLTEHKFMNVGEDIVAPGKPLEAFRLLVDTWPKYERLMYEMGITFDRKWGNKPGIEETIFKILPGFQRKNV